MNFILDNPETEKLYQQLLLYIQAKKNGEISELMSKNGIVYKMNWGVSIVELRQIAEEFLPDHLLALKLWNKHWRETMILATMMDEPQKVTEEQMDFWTKSIENTEIAEQASTNLWVKSKFGFVKSIEWCRGKKHLVRYTGIHLAGRLAMVAKNDPDEMFEMFFDELPILARDPKLFNVMYRTLIAFAGRSEMLRMQSINLANELKESESDIAKKLGIELYQELSYFASI